MFSMPEAKLGRCVVRLCLLDAPPSTGRTLSDAEHFMRVSLDEDGRRAALAAFETEVVRCKLGAEQLFFKQQADDNQWMLFCGFDTERVATARRLQYGEVLAEGQAIPGSKALVAGWREALKGLVCAEGAGPYAEWERQGFADVVARLGRALDAFLACPTGRVAAI
jgi:hypothetical protein